jgi:hypothetical protein
MNDMCAPIDTGPVEVTLKQKDTSASMVTTLYDLIATIQDVVDPNDDALVVAALRSMLSAGDTTCRANIMSYAG